MAKQKQKRARKRSRRAYWLWAIFLVILIVGGSAYVATLPIWDIQEVVVNGARMLSPNEIRALAAVPVSENLFFTSFNRSKSNLSKITAIKSFRFYRMPPATVLINIREREPLATIIFPHRAMVIDEEGYIIDRNKNISLNIPNRADLPVVSGISEKRIIKKDHLDPRVSRIITEIITILTPYLEGKRLQLQMGGLANVSILLDDMLMVRLGKAEDVSRKMEVFEALLPVVAGKWEEVAYIDVRWPDNPVIKYR